jgi:PrtD family type I secretion system ABC transporter
MAFAAIELGPLRTALRQCRRQFRFVLIFSAVLNTLYLAPSLYMLQVYDRVLVTGGLLTLVFLSIILLASLGVLAYLDATRARILSAVSQRLDYLLTPAVLGAAFHPRSRAAAGPSQPIREFDTVRSALSGAPVLATMDAPWTPIYIGVCFIVHPWLGALGVAGGAVLVALAVINERAVKQSLQDYEQAAAASYAQQTADAGHADTARALGMHERIVHRQISKRAAMAEAQTHFTQQGAGYSSLTKFVRLALQSAALGLGAYLAVQQEISAGSLIACTILIARAFAPLEQIVGAWRQFGQVRASLKVVRDVLAASEPERSYTELPAPRSELAAEGIRVRAPSGEGWILAGVSFKASAGEVLGVIGPSGAGKSTLMRVVAGAVSADLGQVRYDGAKISDWAPAVLGRHIGYLPQEVGLFPGTIAENISRFESAVEAGKSDMDAAIVSAASAAGVHELIQRLPRGYDTVLGSDGRGLSAGQAQRIGLARALYRDPRVLILDEPNAHIDAEGEAALVSALKAAEARGAAIIVVAHRAGFMSIAKRLLVIKDGQVEAFGPREEVTQKMAMASGARPLPALKQSAEQR